MTDRRHTIGEFARLTRLSVTTLRHYDDLGLLVPDSVNQTTGYRYYGPDQVPVALRLGVLRALDTPLADVARWRSGELELTDVLTRRRAEIERQRRRHDEALVAIDAIAAGAFDPTVVVEDLEPQAVAWLSGVVAWDDVEQATRRTLARLSLTLRRAGRRSAPPRGGLFPCDPRDEITLTAFSGTDEPEPPAHVPTMTLPGGRYACATFVGPYALLPLAYRAVLTDLDDRGLAPGDVVREEYLDEVDGLPCTRVCVAAGDPGE